MTETPHGTDPVGHLARQLAELTDRVQAIEQRVTRAPSQAQGPSPNIGSIVENKDLAQHQADWEAREQRRRLIREFDDQEEREYMRRFQPRLDEIKRERLERLNAFLAARGLTPEPME
jgi:hypothetical protein